MAIELESFVVFVQSCEAQVVESQLLLSTPSSHGLANKITVPAGVLAKVKAVLPSSSEKATVVHLRIYDFYERNLAFENNLFACTRADVQVVVPPLWPFLTAIENPSQRTLFRNVELVSYLLSLEVEDLVLIDRDCISSSSGKPPIHSSSPIPLFLTCIVRHIGLVQEIGPGFYLGVEITDDIYDPTALQQENYSEFIREYIPGTDKPSLIVRANAIVLPNTPTGGLRKVSSTTAGVKDAGSWAKLFSNTVEKARNEIQHRASTLKRTKRNRGTEVERQNRASWNSSVNYDDNLQFDQSQGTTAISTTDISTMDGSSRQRKGPEEEGSDKSTSTKSSSQGSGRGPATVKPPIAMGTPGAKKRTVALKPTTILSLEDRDLVIIDGNDIKESVQNESEVIVLDHPPKETASTSGDVDLMDILMATDWPALAGDTAHGLNAADRRSSGGGGGPVVKPQLGELTTRNKSMNIISHLKHSKGNASASSSTLRGHQTAVQQQQYHPGSSGSANSSFESSNSGSNAGERKKKPQPPPPQPPLDGPVYDNLANASVELNRLSLEEEEEREEEEEFDPMPLTEVPNAKLGIGDMVEVQLRDSQSLYGVIQWIGLKQPGNPSSCLVGVELDDAPLDEFLSPQVTLSDGKYAGVRIFKCPANRGIFVSPSKITRDRRFQDQPSTSGTGKGASGGSKPVDNFKMFGHKDCPVVPGFVPPLKILAPSDLEKVCGKFKGIQGHHNSCYLDATLFSMFTFTSVFDSLLFRPPDSKDIASYEEVQTVLRDEIVNPLRKNLFVRADRVMKLRKLLDRLSSVTGLLSEEKDPEEFLNSLLAQILRVQPFLHLSSGQDAYFYQLFVEKDERLSFPSVQQLFEQSFLQSDIKLKEVPSCLIIQMPRFGKDYKLYPKILPSLVLDVTHIIEDSPRPCSICNNLALYECKDCFGVINCVDAFESTAFCHECLERTHSLATGRQNHKTKPLQVPEDFRRMSSNNCITVPHLFMELFAVVCIETSHYVSFTKAGSGQDAPWCFFDSMADRKGEMNGYNIPEMISVSDLAQWLSDEGSQELSQSYPNDKMLPEHARRLFCDAYMCMYSSDIMMYR